jgi:NO-binding membrane sensor protein with MHYT domain
LHHHHHHHHHHLIHLIHRHHIISYHIIIIMVELDREYQAEMIAMSVILAMTGGYSAMEAATVASKAVHGRGWSKLAWIVTTAVMLSFNTVFVMHFVGMQAVLVRTASVDTLLEGFHNVRFSLPIIILSVPPSILTMSISLYFLIMPPYTETVQTILHKPIKFVLCGTFMAVGVGILHYGGVMSICGPFYLHYPFAFILATVVFAVTVCCVAILIILYCKTARDMLVGGMIAGGAVSFVHYFGMIEVQFHALEGSDADSCEFGLSALGGVVSANQLGIGVMALGTISNFLVQIFVPTTSSRMLQKIANGYHHDAPDLHSKYRRDSILQEAAGDDDMHMNDDTSIHALESEDDGGASGSYQPKKNKLQQQQHNGAAAGSSPRSHGRAPILEMTALGGQGYRSSSRTASPTPGHMSSSQPNSPGPSSPGQRSPMWT